MDYLIKRHPTHGNPNTKEIEIFSLKCLFEINVEFKDIVRLTFGEGSLETFHEIKNSESPMPSLYGITILKNFIGKDVFLWMEKYLISHPFLKHLMIFNVELGKYGAKMINTILKGELQSLTLCRCGITFKEVKEIAFGLMDNSCLTYLEFDGNDVGDEGADLIAQSLGGNTRNILATLIIRNDSIGDSGANSLFEMVEHSQHLTKLSLASNKIVNPAKQDDRLTEMLNNSILKSLDLFDNPLLKEETLQTIEKALKNNNFLIELNLTESNAEIYSSLWKLIHCQKRKVENDTCSK